MTDNKNRLPLKGGKMKKVYVPLRYIYIITHNFTNFNNQTVKIKHHIRFLFVQSIQNPLFDKKMLK